MPFCAIDAKSKETALNFRNSTIAMTYHVNERRQAENLAFKTNICLLQDSLFYSASVGGSGICKRSIKPPRGLINFGYSREGLRRDNQRREHICKVNYDKNGSLLGH